MGRCILLTLTLAQRSKTIPAQYLLRIFHQSQTGSAYADLSRALDVIRLYNGMYQLSQHIGPFSS